MPGRFSPKENNKMRVAQLTGSLDAVLIGMNLINAVHVESPFNAIKGLLQHKSPFPLDQYIFHPDYIAFALRFGAMEDR
jgi:hypothetical protein